MKKLSFTIEVDLDVFKAVTAKIESEGQSHNDVLRDLLNLDSLIEADEAIDAFLVSGEAFMKSLRPGQFFSRGLDLPNGTKLRARYKGREYFAEIRDGGWIDHEGKQQVSPSAAATRITETTVNGLRFWEGMRPGDKGWRRLDVIRDAIRK